MNEKVSEKVSKKTEKASKKMEKEISKTHRSGGLLDEPRLEVGELLDVIDGLLHIPDL